MEQNTNRTLIFCALINNSSVIENIYRIKQEDGGKAPTLLEVIEQTVSLSKFAEQLLKD